MEALGPVIELIKNDGSMALLCFGIYYLYRENKAKDKVIEDLRKTETDHLREQLALFQALATKAE